MPTLGRTIAKNRTQLFQQMLIDGQLGNICPDRQPGSVIYYGKTTNNTTTELYINGKGPAIEEGGSTYYYRLYLPESTMVFGRATYMYYNATDDAFGMSHTYFAAQNLNGTTAAAFDLNKSGGTNDLEVALDFDATSGDLDLLQLGTATGALAADDTDDFLKVNVTGITGKTMYWIVVLECFVINETNVTSNFFFGDTAAQNSGD